jgi:hypothetical protein
MMQSLELEHIFQMDALLMCPTIRLPDHSKA